ncbi:hypothetical protein ACFYW1_31475 [Streptomyces sp. NPDC002669]|uniref:hypothetical protein n=1 Tax=Streptomyces sp. NPDC002669 TaxID=3364658 RepID=UPI0036D1924A
MTWVWAGFWAGSAVPVGAAVDEEEEGDGVAESRVERVVETGALRSVCRAVNASQTRETDIAALIPTVTVPMSSAGDCLRLPAERPAECFAERPAGLRAGPRTAGSGPDGSEDGEGGEEGEGVPGRWTFSSKSSMSAGRAPWPSRREADTFPKTRSSPEGTGPRADCGADSSSGVRDANC